MPTAYIFLMITFFILSLKFNKISIILLFNLIAMLYPKAGGKKLKVAHHTWIKFLKSRRNSLMMKNEVTYIDMDIQKANEKSFFLVKI